MATLMKVSDFEEFLKLRSYNRNQEFLRGKWKIIVTLVKEKYVNISYNTLKGLYSSVFITEYILFNVSITGSYSFQGKCIN